MIAPQLLNNNDAAARVFRWGQTHGPHTQGGLETFLFLIVIIF